MANKEALKGADTPRFPTVRPVDIPLIGGVDLDNGAIFVKLKTFESLDSFWTNNKEMKFAAEGDGDGSFLQENEWVFGPTKQSVVRAVMRWKTFDIRCEWYDDYAANPEFHKAILEESRNSRTEGIMKGDWDALDEQNFRAWEAGTYNGRWVLVNLPLGQTHDELFSEPNLISKPGEVYDRKMDLRFVEALYQRRIFDESDSNISLLEDGVSFRTSRDMVDLVNWLRDNPEERKDFFQAESNYASEAEPSGNPDAEEQNPATSTGPSKLYDQMLQGLNNFRTEDSPPYTRPN